MSHTKYYIALVKFKGMSFPDSYRLNGPTRNLKKLENQIKEQNNKTYIEKRLFEIDRKTGSIEEF